MLFLTDGVALAHGRAHEACGPARATFALWLAAAAKGPVLWISPGRTGGQLNPAGMAGFADPARFLFVNAPKAEDTLWTMEEALRCAAAPLVVAELPEPPPMTPVRRLHLAAAGSGSLGPPPLGLLLTPGSGGAQGIESRWHLSPACSSTGLGTKDRQHNWVLLRLRARTLPPCSWQISLTAACGPQLTATVCPDSALAAAAGSAALQPALAAAELP